MKYPHIVSEFYSRPWAILPEKLQVIAELIEYKANGGDLTAEEVQERIGAALPRGPRPAGGAVAVLPLFGTIAPRMNLMIQASGGVSLQNFAQAFRQAMADPGVKAIIIDVDSPGGSVAGVPEMASEILAARGRKPIVAVADTLMASAAYWIASAVDDIAASPSAEVGSIGVFGVHQDISKALDTQGVKMTLISAGKYKTEGNPYEPLTDEAKTALQASVNDFYGMFVAAVAKGRGTTAQAVREGYGQGRVVGAREALRLGMVDRIATLDETIGRLMGGRTGTAVAAETGDYKLTAAEVAEIAEAIKPFRENVPDEEVQAHDRERRQRRLRIMGA